ncbi:hypothetical protein CK934_01580 [Chitinophaga sp. MD30]|nr:hypothetical protein CK934_01580 [Chitinophaga sp. MD30]
MVPAAQKQPFIQYTRPAGIPTGFPAIQPLNTCGSLLIGENDPFAERNGLFIRLNRTFNK